MDAMLSRGVAPVPVNEDDRLPAEANGLDQIYRRERPRLLRLLSRRVSTDCAEDMIQQMFVRLVKRDGGGHAPVMAPGAYLREAAGNLVRDRARALARTGEDRHVAVEDLPLASGDPVAMLEARDRLARIEQAVGRLKPLTREIFLACRLDGYSYAEIAERTGLSVRGVEKQMSRALKQLGRQLRSHD